MTKRYSRRNSRRNSRRAPLDQERADDLKLFIDNDSRLYEMGRAYRAALAKRVAKGNFNVDLAAKGFGWIVEEGAKKYVREFPPETGLTKWSDIFSPATRDAVAKEIAQDWWSEHKIQHGIKSNRRRRLVRNAQYLAAGMRVRAPGYGFGTVRQVHGETAQVEFDAGGVEWTPSDSLITTRTTKSGSSRRNPRKRTSRRNARWKVWTGPTQVHRVAQAYRAFPGISGVMEGTEHVHFTYDGDPRDLMKRGVPALVRAYAIGTSDTGIKPVRNGRKRTSRRARRTSRRRAA